jgi:Fe-S cluster biogenesis protein NfuA
MPDTDTFDIEATGARIDALLDRIADACGAAAADLADELVRDLLSLYGAGLERILALVRREAGDADEVVRALGDDGLVAGLLALHDLHPVPVDERVARTLAQVRATTGAVIDLVAVDSGTVRVKVDVSGCASSADSLRQAIEATVQRAAPEVTAVVVEQPGGGGGRLIPAESLLRRPREHAS